MENKLFMFFFLAYTEHARSLATRMLCIWKIQGSDTEHVNDCPNQASFLRHY